MHFSAPVTRTRHRYPEAAPTPNTSPSSDHLVASQPVRAKFDATCWPKKIPLIVARCGPAAIMGHMMPRGIGANGFLAASS